MQPENHLNTIKQTLLDTACLMENLENSLTAILNTPEFSCEHYVINKIKENANKCLELLK